MSRRSRFALQYSIGMPASGGGPGSRRRRGMEPGGGVDGEPGGGGGGRDRECAGGVCDGDGGRRGEGGPDGNVISLARGSRPAEPRGNTWTFAKLALELEEDRQRYLEDAAFRQRWNENCRRAELTARAAGARGAAVVGADGKRGLSARRCRTSNGDIGSRGGEPGASATGGNPT